MLDKRFDFLREENVMALNEEESYELYKKACTKLEDVALNYEKKYGSIEIDGHKFIFITDVIVDEDCDWEQPLRRAICPADGINYECCGQEPIYGWTPLYDIWFNEGGTVDDYDQQLVYNVFTDDDWF